MAPAGVSLICRVLQADPPRTGFAWHALRCLTGVATLSPMAISYGKQGATASQAMKYLPRLPFSPLLLLPILPEISPDLHGIRYSPFAPARVILTPTLDRIAILVRSAPGSRPILCVRITWPPATTSSPPKPSPFSKDDWERWSAVNCGVPGLWMTCRQVIFDLEVNARIYIDAEV